VRVYESVKINKWFAYCLYTCVSTGVCADCCVYIVSVSAYHHVYAVISYLRCDVCCYMLSMVSCMVLYVCMVLSMVLSVCVLL